MYIHYALNVECNHIEDMMMILIMLVMMHVMKMIKNMKLWKRENMVIRRIMMVIQRGV